MHASVNGLVAASLLIAVSCATPPRAVPVSEVAWLSQGWTREQQEQFHHTTQGTMTIPIRYEWFAALEQPQARTFGAGIAGWFQRPGLLSESTYLARFGFISGPVSRYNQAGLPVGFSVDYGTSNPAIAPGNFNAIGFTCAACHTGHLRYQGTEVRYNGGPALTNLALFTEDLALSLLETYLQGSRFDRFSARVLGVQNTDRNRTDLRKELAASLKSLIAGVLKPAELKLAGIHEVLAATDGERLRSAFERARALIRENEPTDEGFARLDALTRIGNTVFGSDTQRYENLAVIQAPVSYPHIWNASWFLWVQYDASIMQPMVRNAGEALGVSAFVTLNGSSPERFRSSVRLDNLAWIEDQLAGSDPVKAQGFNGLRAPEWPEAILGSIDAAKHAQGQVLYRELCQSCHLAPVDSPEFWSDPHWTAVGAAGRRYLDLPIVDVAHIGTDPQQAKVLSQRTVDTRGIGLSTEIWVEQIDWFGTSPVYGGGRGTGSCQTKRIEDGQQQSYAFSLGAVVQEVNDSWYSQHQISPEEQQRMNGGRQNCLRAPNAYKARPLDGIWATAPFLHNGSVPSLYDLLSPVAERPTRFHVGSLEFDPRKVGYRTEREPGLFELNTALTGNSNAGHEFSDEQRPGVIGRALTESERYALIEFLKDPRAGRSANVASGAPPQ
jgi:hypothetical protein